MEVHLRSLYEYHIAPILAIQAQTISEGNTPDFCFLPVGIIRFAFIISGTIADVNECIVGIISLAVSIQVGREYRLSAQQVVVGDFCTGHCSGITALKNHPLRDDPLIGVDVRRIGAFHQIELGTRFSICQGRAEQVGTGSVFP